jgi:hypothetical protein
VSFRCKFEGYADHVLLLLLCSHFKGDITKS